MDYLSAIHAIPGKIPGEKFKYISSLAHEFSKTGISIEDPIDPQRLPEKMLPLFRLEFAKITNNSKIIAESLKSDDHLVVKRALRISKFFQAKDENIVNPEYFRVNLLPQISTSTRQKVIKKLATHLPPEKSQLAENMFQMINDKYGFIEAHPLLVACNENYLLDKCNQYQDKPSVKMMKILFRKNPKTLMRCIKECFMDNRGGGNFFKNMLRFGSYYKNYITNLLTTDVEKFKDVYRYCQFSYRLSEKKTKLLMKNAKEHVLKKPSVFINHICLSSIDAETMKLMMKNLMTPEQGEYFPTEYYLRNDLKYLPDKVGFLINIFEETYGKSIFDDTKSITPELMLHLPIEQRNFHARRILERERSKKSARIQNYKYVWRCYLPTNEIIQKIKKEINRELSVNGRVGLLSQITWSCYVNKDFQALSEFLQYFNKTHINESSELIMHFIDDFLQIHEFRILNPFIHELVKNIVQRTHAKGNFIPGQTANDVLSTLVRYELRQNFPIDEMLTIYIEFAVKTKRDWNILIDNPEYEEACLKKSIVIAINECNNVSDEHKWFYDTYKILFDLLSSICEYRKRHQKNIDLSKVIEDIGYPNLLKISLQSVWTKADHHARWKELVVQCFMDPYEVREKVVDKNLPKPSEDRALTLLKKDPHQINKHCGYYLEECMNDIKNKRVQLFVRRIRWYTGISHYWLEICEREFKNTHNQNALYIIGLLVDGESFANIISPFKELFVPPSLVSLISRVMNIVNPPPSFETIGRFWERNPTSQVLLITLINKCRRTGVTQANLYLDRLIRQKNLSKKHQKYLKRLGKF